MRLKLGVIRPKGLPWPLVSMRSLRWLAGACLALFVAMAAIGLTLVRLEASQRSAAADRLVVAEAAEVRAALGDRLSHNVNLARGLSAFMAANPDLGDPDRFELLLAGIYEQGSDVRNIGVAPDNVITHVYPLEGNEAAVGLRYADLPSQYAAVELAVRTRRPVLTGPVDLVQGGSALIDRTPVFLRDGSYWGVVSLVLDVDGMLEGVRTDTQNFDLEWAVRTVATDIQPTTDVGGDAALFGDADAVLTMAVPNSTWELAVRSTASGGSDVLLVTFYVLAVVLAALISRLVFERSRDRRRSRMLSLHDDLTGLANRRLLEERAQRAIARARRAGTPVSFAYVDLDDFKPINDDYGHRAGDEVLRAVASRLAGRVRDADTVARVGGDEFVVLLPDTDDRGAAALVTGLAEAVGRPIAVGGRDLVVGASFGVATYPDDGDSFESLLAHADSRMYQVKAADAGGGAEAPAGDLEAFSVPGRTLVGVSVDVSAAADR